jgi:hypothetical protein
MELALDKIPFLAFAKSLEQWRWDVYDETIKVRKKLTRNVRLTVNARFN